MPDIKDIWKSQSVEEKTMLTLSEVQQRAQRFQMNFHWRNVVLYAYSIFNIAASLWLVATGQFNVMHTPMLVMVVAHLFVLWQVWKRFGPRKVPAQASGQAVLQFHRQELERQHQAVSKAWLWYIAPFMPAFIWELAIWVNIINVIGVHTPAGTASLKMFMAIVFSSVLFWGCFWLLFSRHATRLELELERLTRVRAE